MANTSAHTQIVTGGFATTGLAVDGPRGAAGTDRMPTGEADVSLKELERRHIEEVLADSQTLVQAAARLGIDTATLWRKRKRYGMK